MIYILRLVIIILLGIISGEIVNFLADILPTQKRISHPICTFCQKNILIIEYISYQKCHYCGKKRSTRSLLVQIFFPLLFVILWLLESTHTDFWVFILLFVYFGLVVTIDIEHHLILRSIIIVGLLIGLPIGIILHGIQISLLGGITGYGIMLGFYFLGIGFLHIIRKIRVQTTNDVALGFGDVNLSAILGFILGYSKIFEGILIAILLGGLVSLVVLIYMLLLRRYKPLIAIPYSPFLIAGTLFILIQESI